MATMHPGSSEGRSEACRSLLGGRLVSVPCGDQASVLAELVRERLELGRGIDLARVCSQLGWTIREERLGAAEGGQQAALLPRTSGGFTILIDPDLTPAEAAAEKDIEAVERIRLAHELAHTLFYSETTPPRRGMETSPREEDFCDAFADAVLNPAKAPVPAFR